MQGVLSNEKMKAKEREAKPLDERARLNPALRGSLQTSCLLGTRKADRKALQRRHLAFKAWILGIINLTVDTACIPVRHAYM